jgi:hypothetical protein
VNVNTLAGGNSSSLISSTPSETAVSSGALRVLKAMVGAWLRDVGLHQNAFADFQISYFYR